MEAIAAYTIEGAYAEFAEDRKGMIRKGYFADLTLLDASVEDMPAEQLHSVRPARVICGGRTTFHRREIY
jgi:predicted amidohydrolase YtcJ